MKNILVLVFMMSVVISCGDDEKGSSVKPISGQIPSDNKLVLEGTAISNSASIVAEASTTVDVTESADPTVDPVPTVYPLLDRLYDTVWFQSEEDIDDGVVEVETEFLFFKKIGTTVRLDEVEMENGIIDPPDGDNEYSELTEIDNTVDTTTLNAFVAKNIEFENGAVDDAEYEGYYLRDNRTLYVIDGGSKVAVASVLKSMLSMTEADLERKYNEDRYLLSEKPNIGELIPTPPVVQKTKPVATQSPSTKKLVLEGTAIASGASVVAVDVTESADPTVDPVPTEYPLLERLYGTTWFQSEKDTDDGVVEIETEFLLFKKIDNKVKLEEIEMQNGIIDLPDGDNEYSELTDIDNTVDPTKLNAFVAKNIEYENGVVDDELEYEGYFLKDAKTLYVIDGSSKVAVKTALTTMLTMTDADLEVSHNDDKYLLSEKSDITVK